MEPEIVAACFEEYRSSKSEQRPPHDIYATQAEIDEAFAWASPDSAFRSRAREEPITIFHIRVRVLPEIRAF